MKWWLLLCVSGQVAFAQATAPAHFHHVHLNSTDPAAAVEFYTKHFDCESRAYEGKPAVWAQKSWLLFNRVAKAPPTSVGTAIWHIGWGAEDMPAAYERQLELGAKFQTPLSDISDLALTKGFYYAYVDGPDHALIELNTARHHHFGHLHLFSDDPIAAGEWYIQNFGAKSLRKAPYSREARFYKRFSSGAVHVFDDGQREHCHLSGRTCAKSIPGGVGGTG